MGSGEPNDVPRPAKISRLDWQPSTIRFIEDKKLFSALANLSLRGVSGSPASLGSDRTRALQPCITGEGGADFDLLQGIIVNLRSRHVPSLALGHDGDLLFLAVGSVNRAVFGDLKIALALDGSVGWFE
jgi:hypothetical protein